jgi:hypothetical protein
MKSPKIQRWIDLLAALLARRWPATFDELIRDVPAYAAGDQSHETRRRMFERDKDELREFGIPIETITAQDEGDPPGYQLRVRNFYLPYLALRAEGKTKSPRPAARRARRVGDAEAGVRPAGGRGGAPRCQGGRGSSPRGAGAVFDDGGRTAQAEARHLHLPHHGERRHGSAHGRALRPLLSQPALVPGGAHAGRGDRQELPSQPHHGCGGEREAALHAGLRDPRRFRSPGACPLPAGLGARHR